MQASIKNKAAPATQITVSTFTGSPSPKYNTHANFPDTVHFPGNATSNGAHFPANATFNGAPFPGIMSFNGAGHFNGLANFAGGSSFNTSAAFLGMSAFSGLQPQHGGSLCTHLLPPPKRWGTDPG